MALKLYYNLVFPSSRTVYMFLNEAKIPFEKKVINTKGVEILEKDKKLFRFNNLPVLQDGDFKIMESVAIIRYLCNKYPNISSLYPQDSKKQAKIDEYLSWTHHNTSFLCFIYYQQQFLKPFLSGKKPNVSKLEPFKDRMMDSIDKLEEVWLAETKFLAGNDLTVADISCLNDIEQTKMAGYDPTYDRPLLSDWITRVKNLIRPNYEEIWKAIPKDMMVQS